MEGMYEVEVCGRRGMVWGSGGKGRVGDWWLWGIGGECVEEGNGRG